MNVYFYLNSLLLSFFFILRDFKESVYGLCMPQERNLTTSERPVSTIANFSVYAIYQCEDKCLRRKECNAYKFYEEECEGRKHKCQLLAFNVSSSCTESLKNFTYTVLDRTLIQTEQVNVMSELLHQYHTLDCCEVFDVAHI